jgi:raffinose/stachyose/melibiose transport system permease protein
VNRVKKRRLEKPRHSPLFYLFLAPSLFAFIMVIVIPFFMGLYYSFTNWTAITGIDVSWVGTKNYAAIFKDNTFLHSFLVTTAFAGINIVVLNVIAFSLALLVTQKLKLVGLYRAAFFLPNLIGGIVLGYIWQFIFNNAIPHFGKVSGLTWFYDNLFLGNRYLSLLAIVIVGTWQYAGYIMMIYVAAIQGIPPSLTEAASIDGARFRQMTRHVVFPLVAPAFTVSMFLTLVNSFKQFDVNFALTAGGPSGMFLGRALMTTELLSLNIYETAFSFRRLAEGQAKAVVFFVVIAIVALIQVYFNKRKEIEM